MVKQEARKISIVKADDNNGWITSDEEIVKLDKMYKK